jgi:hypothetical protein
VNENTRHQWERYCDAHPELDAHDCLALYWLVHMHSAREGFTRPGVRLLGAKTHLSKDGVTAVLRRLQLHGSIELKEPAAGRLAALWTIPWLLNVAPRIQGANQGANQGASKALRALGARHPSQRPLEPLLRPEIIEDNEHVAAMGYGQ